jgi:hypothetical protein
MNAFERGLLVASLVWSVGALVLNYKTTTALEVTASGVPSGADIVVTSGGCPGGYTEDTVARGRVLVHTQSGGTVGSTVGTALEAGYVTSFGQGHNITGNASGLRLIITGSNVYVGSPSGLSPEMQSPPTINILLCKKS